MNDTERVIQRVWAEMQNTALQEHFPRISFQDAIERYGTDKPDLRFSIRNIKIEHKLPANFISRVSKVADPFVEVMILKTSKNLASNKNLVRKALEDFLSSPEAATFHKNPHSNLAFIPYDSSRPLCGLSALGSEGAEEIKTQLSPSDGDYLIFQARPKTPVLEGSTALGSFRSAIQSFALKQGLIIPEKPWAPLWVVDFPLFTPTSASSPGQGGMAGLSSTHHPFTSPKTPADVDLLRTDPTKTIADHYDLVINGVELGGGSRRIHDPNLQTYVLKNVLKMSVEKLAHFDHLIEVLASGCPPHAGIALGMDRLVAMVLERDSVRDVIAFPKTGKGEDPLMRSPGKLDEETLNRYHLKIRDEGNTKFVSSKDDPTPRSERREKTVKIDITKLSSEDAHTVRQLVERLAESSPKRHQGECARPLHAARKSIPDQRATSPDVPLLPRGNMAPVSANDNLREDIEQSLPNSFFKKWIRRHPSRIRREIQNTESYLERLRGKQEAVVETANKPGDLLGAPPALEADAPLVSTEDDSYNHVRKQHMKDKLEGLRKMLQWKGKALADNTTISKRMSRPSFADTTIVSPDAESSNNAGLGAPEINIRKSIGRPSNTSTQKDTVAKIPDSKVRKYDPWKPGFRRPVREPEEQKRWIESDYDSVLNEVVNSPETPLRTTEDTAIPSTHVQEELPLTPRNLPNIASDELLGSSKKMSPTSCYNDDAAVTAAAAAHLPLGVQELPSDPMPRYLPVNLDELLNSSEVLPITSTQNVDDALDTDSKGDSSNGDKNDKSDAADARPDGQSKEDSAPRYLGATQ